MFTGLIETTGTVVELTRINLSAKLKIQSSLPVNEIKIGESIAVNGVCLTVTTMAGSDLSFDLSPESLSCTTLGNLSSGKKINMERALRLGDRLGGHIVSGHIDCIAKLEKRQELSHNLILHFSMKPENTRHIIAKGSITIDGISLTVNSVTKTGFSVNIIPHTGNETTIANIAVGDLVNIETDIMGKYIEKFATPWNSSGSLTMQTLAENGFL